MMVRLVRHDPGQSGSAEVARRTLGRLSGVAPLILWLAVFFFIFDIYFSLDTVTLAVIAAVSATAFSYLAVRHGLVAFLTYYFLQMVSLTTVFTLDPSVWYFPPPAIFFVLILGMIIFGIMTATDRKVFPSRR